MLFESLKSLPIFFKKAEKVPSMFQNIGELIKILKKFFSSNWSFGHVECKYSKPVEISSAKTAENFRSITQSDLKMLGIWFRKNCFSSKCSSGYVESSSDNPADKIWPEGQWFFEQITKMMKIIFFAKKHLSLICFSSTRRLQFWQPRRKKVRRNGEKHSLRMSKSWQHMFWWKT